MVDSTGTTVSDRLSAFAKGIGLMDDTGIRRDEVEQSSTHAYPDLQIVGALDVGIFGKESPSFRIVMDWIESYIIKPNRQLGRTGAVCPFVSHALAIRSLWVSVVDQNLRNAEEVCQILRSFISIYQSFKTTSEACADLKTFIIVFPKLAG